VIGASVQELPEKNYIRSKNCHHKVLELDIQCGHFHS